MSEALAPVHARPVPFHKRGVQAATRPRAGKVVERLVALRSGVTTPHVVAVLRLRAAWAVGGGASPAVQAALRAVGRDATPLLLHVCIYDRTVQAWCALPMNNQAGPADAAKVLGRVLFALDVLAMHYSTTTDQVSGL